MCALIKIDYEATLSTAKEFGSVSDALADCSKRTASIISGLSSWDGMAAKSGKGSLTCLQKTLGEFDGAWVGFGKYLESAAESLTFADQQAADSMKADWISEAFSGGGGAW